MLSPDRLRPVLLSALILFLIAIGPASSRPMSAAELDAPFFAITSAPTSGPVLTVAFVPGKNHLLLSWTVDAAYCSYEVHRDTNPYFDPSASTLAASLPTGTASYVDYLAAHNVDFNYFYLVRGISCSTGEPTDSNRAGEFDFPLQGSENAWKPVYRAHGLNYGPYINADENPTWGGNQITDEELADRLALIGPYTQWIRTFGCNDDLKEAGRFAHTIGLRAAIGAWLGPDTTPQGQQANRDQIDCLKQLIQAGQVDMAIVGSEVLLRGDLSADQLIIYINEVKDFVVQAGLSVPVTTADTYGALLANDPVLDAVDLVMANYYPYWEGHRLAYAMHYLHVAHQQLESEANGKEVIVSETGWPSEGNPVGDAVPSPDNASYYFRNFVSWAEAEDARYFYFEAYDEQWKWTPETPQEAHWGVWTNEGVLKPDMIRVFNGERTDDTWTNPPPDVPFIHFPSLPYRTDTNIPDFVVASFTDPDNQVLFDGVPLLDGAMDAQGNFAFTVSLVEGANTLVLSIQPPGQPPITSEKRVYYDPSLSTADRRLLYVHSVAAAAGIPALPGTIVIDLDSETVLGLIKDKYVLDIAPGSHEAYTTDRAAISTASHTQVRTLAFSSNIAGNGFLVSRDGTRLYSQNERLEVASNTLLVNLPVSIVSGGSYWGTTVRGGPAISADGRRIYIGRNVQVIDTEANTVVATPISSQFFSDMALSPDEQQLLISEFSSEVGRLNFFDATTFASLASVSNIGDYAGEIAFSADGQRAVVGSAGNPYKANGHVNVVDLQTHTLLWQNTVPLADNITTSGDDEFYVSAGKYEPYPRYGIDVYVLQPSGSLARTKTYFLGINRYEQSTGGSTYDQIRRIVFKP